VPLQYFRRFTVDDRARLLEIVREKSYQKKKVVLASGRESDFYIDCRQTALNAEGAFLIGKLMYGMLKSGKKVEGVGGPTLGADPIVTAISMTSYMEGEPVPAFIVRKEPKGHGTGQWIEGRKNLREGADVAVVEDVVTTGGSMLKAADRVKAEGFNIIRVLALVDREEGGREAVKEAGYDLEVLFTKTDIEGK
jgi:orotate phosphoribosyltransferase